MCQVDIVQFKPLRFNLVLHLGLQRAFFLGKQTTDLNQTSVRCMGIVAEGYLSGSITTS